MTGVLAAARLDFFPMGAEPTHTVSPGFRGIRFVSPRIRGTVRVSPGIRGKRVVAGGVGGCVGGMSRPSGAQPRQDPARAVSNDDVHSLIDAQLEVFLLINRPHVHLTTRGVHTFNVIRVIAQYLD